MGALQTKKMEPRLGEQRWGEPRGGLQTKKMEPRLGTQKWSALQTKKIEPRLPELPGPCRGRCLHP